MVEPYQYEYPAMDPPRSANATTQTAGLMITQRASLTHRLPVFAEPSRSKSVLVISLRPSTPMPPSPLRAPLPGTISYYTHNDARRESTMNAADTPGSERTTRLTSQAAPAGASSMWRWHRYVPWWRVVWDFTIVYGCRYCPSLRLKNALYRMLGMSVGKRVSPGLGVVMDIFFPRLISIGDDTIIGYDSVILTHEFLVSELRTGPVEIGSGVMIGANCTILPGVRIEDGATVSACSLVNSDIPAGAMAGGVPARVLSRSADRSADKRSPRDHG